MDNPQVQITEQLPKPVTSVATPLAPKLDMPSLRHGGVRGFLGKALKRLASLQLTVTLFALSIFLVFCGTLAQVDNGIWTVVAKYFRSLYVWVPLQIFISPFSKEAKVGGGFPFPGGWLLGSLLLVNLLAAHAVRFKATWKRSGIILLHAGLIVIMVSELVTGLFAVEGSMLIYEDKSANYLFHPRETELSITEVGQGATAEVAVVPMTVLRETKGLIKNEALPVDVEVVQYMVNSRLCRLKVPPEFLSLMVAELPEAPPNAKNPATAGLGAKFFLALDQPETGGVEQDKEDLAAAYVRFRQKTTGQDLGTFLLPLLLEDEPQYLTVDGKKYDVRLRFRRSYKDYTVHLLEFRHDKYVGTETPKNYSSKIRLTEASKNVDREVLISMNDPLRYNGETFYQQSFRVMMGRKATILQVVQNPGWLMPYISCVMVAAGMLIHFGFHLQTFLGRRAAK